MATVTAMQLGSRRMLGEILMELGLIDRAQLRLALVHHHETRVPLGRALVREGLCPEGSYGWRYFIIGRDPQGAEFALVGKQ